MPTMEFIRGENIEGDGASTELHYWNFNPDGRDIQVTTTMTNTPNGSELVMVTWWYNDNPVASTMWFNDNSINDNGADTVVVYASEQGEAFQPVTIVGGGGRTLPPEEFNLDQ